MSVKWDDYKLGDLVQTTVDLIVRNDGFTFDRNDVGGKIPRDWLKDADSLPAGTFCTFIGKYGGVVDTTSSGTPNEDDEYALVRRDMVGRPMMVRFAVLSMASPIEDAVEDVENLEIQADE